MVFMYESRRWHFDMVLLLQLFITVSASMQFISVMILLFSHRLFPYLSSHFSIYCFTAHIFNLSASRKEVDNSRIPSSLGTQSRLALQEHEKYPAYCKSIHSSQCPSYQLHSCDTNANSPQCPNTMLKYINRYSYPKTNKENLKINQGVEEKEARRYPALEEV